jgi:hypothetical protein
MVVTCVWFEAKIQIMSRKDQETITHFNLSRKVSSIGRALDCESGDPSSIPDGAGHFRCD